MNDKLTQKLHTQKRCAASLLMTNSTCDKKLAVCVEIKNKVTFNLFARSGGGGGTQHGPEGRGGVPSAELSRVRRTQRFRGRPWHMHAFRFTT